MLLDYYIVITTIAYGVSVLIWLVNAFLFPRISRTSSEETVDSSEIQVRILTIDNRV